MTKKYIYINAAKEKFYVTEEEYREFYREVDAKRKREQYHHRCVCPKEFLWKCDGDCDICEFHRNGDICSLDYENDDGEGLMDKVTEDKVMEDLIADSMLLESLIQKLCKLDPDGARMVEIWKENPNTSDREIARQLGRKQRTFAYHIKKVREILKKYAQTEE